MDKSSEIEILAWLKEVLSLKIDEKREDLMELLTSGVVLCNVINKFMPKTCLAKESSIVFKRMENIEMFLKAAKSIGVLDSELFQTVDLVYPDKRNPKQVAICIYSLSRNLKKKFPGSKYKVIGPKLAEKQTRTFSEEQLEMGKRIISVQMGTNKGATQSGLGSGHRQITPENQL
ncbi:transgelin [Nematocida homosporus]|uniref:transgelin n=1 Tax=Nematocida homosporus TaxID=1912981 RepID=UPI00221FE28B|nr:transgelin [Nematocida homosporus]KAI5185815.1 transgelin [Nematocida homosporus]